MSTRETINFLLQQSRLPPGTMSRHHGPPTCVHGWKALPAVGRAEQLSRGQVKSARHHGAAGGTGNLEDTLQRPLRMLRMELETNGRDALGEHRYLRAGLWGQKDKKEEHRSWHEPGPICECNI